MTASPTPKSGATKRSYRGIRLREDGDSTKKFPNGIKATINAIRKCWPKYMKTKANRNCDEFAALFIEKYNEVASHYGEATKSVSSLASAIRDLDGSGQNDPPNIRFLEMRAYAEYVGLPTSLFLLFTQAVSFEAQGRRKVEVSDFLARSRKAIQTLEQHFGDTSEEEQYFHTRVSDEEIRARLVGLYKMSQEFNRSA